MHIYRNKGKYMNIKENNCVYIGMPNKSPRWCPRWRCRQPAKWSIGVFQPAKWSIGVFPTREMEHWCCSNPRNERLEATPTSEMAGWERGLLL